MATSLSSLGSDASRAQQREAVEAAIRQSNTLNGIDEEGKHQQDVDPTTGQAVSKPTGATSAAAAVQQIKSGSLHDIGTHKVAMTDRTKAGHHDGFKRKQSAVAATQGTPLRNTET